MHENMTGGDGYDQQVAVVERELVQEYLAKKRQLHGPRFKPTSRLDARSYWKKAAEKCVALGARPSDLVQAVFERVRDPAAVCAATFTGDFVERAWSEYLASAVPAGDDLVDVFDMPGDVFLDQMISTARTFLVRRSGTEDPIEDNLYVLRRVMFPVPDLGRIYFCKGDPETMDSFADFARDILMTRPDLNEAAKSRKDFPYKELMSWKKRK
jgi:hypothetical protein